MEITIPNSLVLSGQILDYSHYSQDRGLVVHSKVTIGYDVPWVKVHQLLMDAAKRTEGILKDYLDLLGNLANSINKPIFLGHLYLLP